MVQTKKWLNENLRPLSCRKPAQRVVLICTACESKAFLHNSTGGCSQDNTQHTTIKKWFILCDTGWIDFHTIQIHFFLTIHHMPGTGEECAERACVCFLLHAVHAFYKSPSLECDRRQGRQHFPGSGWTLLQRMHSGETHCKRARKSCRTMA